MKLQIEKIIYGGQGLARVSAEDNPHGGMSVFVPFVLPDEIVEAEITEEHRGYGVAEALKIERASEFRVPPPCPWFGTCGGCQLQHGSYSHQLELKRGMLAESLLRAGIRDLPTITTVAAEPWGYRNRVRLQVQVEPEFAIGYRRSKSHHITAIDCCPIAAPLLDRCIVAIKESGLRRMLPEDVRELELFTNHDQSELLVTLWTLCSSAFEASIYAEFFSNMQEQIPQFSGALVLPMENKRMNAARPLLSCGRENLQYLVAGRRYTVSLRSFFQVNRMLLDDFVAAVIYDQSGKCAWDLYAGVGLFSLALAERFDSVIAVESSAAASADLRRNLHDANATVESSMTLDFLRQAARQIVERRQRAPDLVLLDPPRAGIGAEACSLLARCNTRRIVYVSCDPATLGRDLALLIQSGYRLERLQLVDMFPQTYHLETIATLNR